MNTHLIIEQQWSTRRAELMMCMPMCAMRMSA